MERKVGEVFTYNGKTYQVIETNACKDCAFKVRLCEAIESITGTCIPGERTDNTSVSFKLINNMEIKNNQLTIDIPKGYEIDKENSTFECIKFKPIKKYLTYKEVAEKLNKDTCFFIAKGKIQSYAQYASYDNPGVANSYRQIEKILAINQLMNIAKYYNGDWNPNWGSLMESKYYIYYSTRSNTYGVSNTSSTNYGNIYFRLYKDAKAVIDNPNFRDILDKIYKN